MPQDTPKLSVCFSKRLRPPCPETRHRRRRSASGPGQRAAQGGSRSSGTAWLSRACRQGPTSRRRQQDTARPLCNVQVVICTQDLNFVVHLHGEPRRSQGVTMLYAMALIPALRRSCSSALMRFRISWRDEEAPDSGLSKSRSLTPVADVVPKDARNTSTSCSEWLMGSRVRVPGWVRM